MMDDEREMFERWKKSRLGGNNADEKEYDDLLMYHYAYMHYTAILWTGRDDGVWRIILYICLFNSLVDKAMYHDEIE